MAHLSSRSKIGRWFTFQGILLLLAIGVVSLFLSGKLVIQGVPSSVIVRFLQDDVARNAYIQGDRRQLHDRLRDIGIEEDIKAHYRPAIPDEAALDQYIHQIFYERTGYVGDGYQLSPTGTLIPKDSQ
jgi:hypothetical protein